MGSVVSTTAFPARPDEYGSVLQFIQPAVLPATAADSSAWYDCDLCSLSCDSVELNLSATAAISSDCQHDYEFGRLVSLDVASMNIDEAWTDATKEELSRVLPNEVTPAGVANTTLVSVDHWSCTDRPRGLHPMSAAQIRLRMERFCSAACCIESFLAPPQHNEPGLVGQYDLPPECPTSYSSSIELREVGSGQPVQDMHTGVYTDANNNNTTPEGVVARVLESFTDQDRHEYMYVTKRFQTTTVLRDYQLLHTNGETGLGCTPLRGTRNYALQLSPHDTTSGDWDPGDGSHLSDRCARVLESFTDQDRLKYYDTKGKTGLSSTPRRARIYGAE